MSHSEIVCIFYSIIKANEGVEKLKDISTLSFWLYFRLKIAPYFKYKSVKSTQKYSRPLSVYYIFLNSIFLQPEQYIRQNSDYAAIFYADFLLLIFTKSYKIQILVALI
jgi:hypothetical protein